jgi:hypothetical protein
MKARCHTTKTLCQEAVYHSTFITYENRKEPLELKIRNVRIFSTNSKIPRQSKESAKK